MRLINTGNTIFLIVSVCCFSASSFADRARPYFQSSRAMSMGNAYTPHDVGYEGVYYNPASAARPNEVQIKPFDLEMIASKGAFGLVTGSGSDIAKMSEVADTLAQNPGTNYAMGFSFLPQLLVKHFSIGLLARGMGEAYVEPGSLNLNYYSFADLGVHGAVGIALWGGVVKLGVGSRFINRAELNKTYTPPEYQGKGLQFSNQWQEGQGVAADIGMILTSPTFALPRFAVSVLDVGSTKLRQKNTLFTGPNALPGAPPDIPQRINAGVGFLLKHGIGTKTAFNFEIKDWANAIKSNPVNYSHAGLEFDARKTFSLRLGFNEGRYWTAGTGLKMMGLGLEFATYGENISHRDGGRVDDRKFVMRMYVDL